MAPLPDCTRCDAAQSLEAIRADGALIWAYCSVCSAQVLIKEGVVVYQGASKTDVKGVAMTDP